MPQALEWDDVVGIGIALLAGILFWIAFQAYRRTPTTRVLLFASAFAVFFGKGMLILVQVFWVGESAVIDALELIADAAVLLLFFLGMIRK